MIDTHTLVGRLAVALASASCVSCDDGDNTVDTSSPAVDPTTSFTSASPDATGATSADTSGGSAPPDLPGSDVTSAGETSGAGLDDLDDDFDGPLAGWSNFRPELATVAVEDGELVLEPGASTVWLDDRVSVLLWKPVSGNFAVTAAVTARRATAPGELPFAGFRFGGLMARNPDEHLGQNYVFVVLGTDTDPSIESKNTRDSTSEYAGPPWPGASGEIRVCRVGATFRLLVREGGAWQVTNEFSREDLPSTLQVGPIAYNNDPLADLRVTVDFVDFAEVASLDDCAS